jgi:hypothetical protein
LLLVCFVGSINAEVPANSRDAVEEYDIALGELYRKDRKQSDSADDFEVRPDPVFLDQAIQASKAALKKQIAEQEKSISALQGEKADLIAQLQAMIVKNKALEDERDSLRLDIQTAAENLNRTAIVLDTTTKSLQDCSADMHTLHQQCNNFKVICNQKLEDITNRYEDAQKDYIGCRNGATKLQNEVGKLERANSIIERKLNKLDQSLEKCSERFNAYRQKSDDTIKDLNKEAKLARKLYTCSKQQESWTFVQNGTDVVRVLGMFTAHGLLTPARSGGPTCMTCPVGKRRLGYVQGWEGDFPRAVSGCGVVSGCDLDPYSGHCTKRINRDEVKEQCEANAYFKYTTTGKCVTPMCLVGPDGSGAPWSDGRHDGFIDEHGVCNRCPANSYPEKGDKFLFGAYKCKAHCANDEMAIFNKETNEVECKKGGSLKIGKRVYYIDADGYYTNKDPNANE